MPAAGRGGLPHCGGVEALRYGLAAGTGSEGGYERVRFREEISPDDVAFEPGVFLLKKAVAEGIKKGQAAGPATPPPPPGMPAPPPETPPAVPGGETRVRTLRLGGSVPSELWNRLGLKVITKLRSADKDLQVGIDLRARVRPEQAAALRSELQVILDELGLAGRVQIDEEA